MQPSSIIDSITRNLTPIHREGWPFIGGFVVAALIASLFSNVLLWILLVLAAWCAYFFRDPRRVTPVSEDFVIAPADGRIAAIASAAPPAELGMGEAALRRVSIFLNIFDCHINRMPARGRIKRQIHKAGAFFNAELDKASEENERNSLLVETGRGELAIVQIAGLIARRIVTFVAEGQQVEQGQRFGLIRFGSRVDVYLPAGAVICVEVGQRAVGGETLLARFDSAPLHGGVRID